MAHIRIASIVLCAAAASLPAAQEASPFARVFDTGTQSRQPLSGDALTGKAGWKLVPQDNLTHRFSGDAAVLNGKLTVVVRGKGGGIEVYSTAAKRKPVLRASLACAAGRSSTAAGLRRVDIVENGSGAVTLAAVFGASPAAAVKLRLTTGAGIVEMKPPRRASTLTVVTNARYVVVPDFFADDMVFDATSLGGVGLPAENFFLNLVDGGNAILMCVWRPRRFAASAGIANSKSGKDANRCSSKIECTGVKSVWLAFLEGAGIWHEGPRHGGWKPPFPAKWRCSQIQRTGFASSWDLAAVPATRPSSPKTDAPVVVYPIDRVLATPLSVYCPTDVLRNTLGVGPCEHILITEGLATPTNPTPHNVMTWVQRQLKRRRGRPSADEVRKRLAEMILHVKRSRARIGQYADLADAVLALCKDTASLTATAKRIRQAVEEGLRAAGPAERTATLAGELPAMFAGTGDIARCDRLAAQLRAIGSAQNRTLSRCRMAACRLRQQCVATAKKNPKLPALAEKIRQRVERVLK